MDFKKDALKMLDEMSGIETKNIENHNEVIVEDFELNVVDDKIKPDISLILENLDQEIENIQEPITGIVNNEYRQSQNDFKPKFLGKLYETPNPLEYPEGTMYKNTRNGVVYIKEGETWEYLVEDGKPGAQGRAGAAGSGVGVDEVKAITTNTINEQVLPQVQILSTTTDQISYIGSQAGWNQRILFARHMGAANFNATSETTFMTSGTGISAIDGNYAGSLYGIPPCIRANFIDSKSRWIKSHFMFGANFGSVAGVTFTINEYWGSIQMNSVTINYNDFQSPPTSGQNFPIELYSMYNWDSGPSSAANIRVHNYYVAYNGAGTTGIVKCREKFPYPVVDLTKDNHICWKGNWSSNSGGQKAYIDFIQYTS